MTGNGSGGCYARDEFGARGAEGRRAGATLALTMTTTTKKEYVLGTGEDELERLGIQHRLWSDAAHAAWKAANLQPGQRVADIGCGPGYASFDLAMMVGHRGRVVGVDESSSFIETLNRQASSRGLQQLSGLVGDVLHLAEAAASPAGRVAELDAGSFDVVYTRWVLCFVKDPGAMLDGMLALLKPGGRLVIQDYFNYTSMSMAPRSRAWEAVVAATDRSWRERGGDPDVMGRVPQWLVERGARIDRLEVHQRLARGHEAMFTWPDIWWRTYTPKLVQMGYVTQAQFDELLGDLERVRREPGRYVVCPPVFEVIATRS